MISKEFEFEKEVKVRRKRKVVKGKVYEYEELYVNVGRVSLPSEFKQFKKVKVKVIVEPIGESRNYKLIYEFHMAECNTLKLLENEKIICQVDGVAGNDLCNIIFDLINPFKIKVDYPDEHFEGKIKRLDEYECVNRIIQLIKEGKIKEIYMVLPSIVTYDHKEYTFIVPLEKGKIKYEDKYWFIVYEFETVDKKHVKITIRGTGAEVEENLQEPKPKVSQYFEALKNAFKRYWSKIPPSYAPLEQLYTLINEELRKMGLSELTFEEHRKYIEYVKREYYNCIDYYEGGLDPKHRHWVYIKEKCLL